MRRNLAVGLGVVNIAGLAEEKYSQPGRGTLIKEKRSMRKRRYE